jgi:signal recognition particle GTPase
MGMIYGWLAAAALSALIGAGAYLYYINTEATIDNLKSELIIKTIANEKAEKIISILQEEADANEEAFAALQYRNKVAEEYQDSLLDILHKHDLTNLASKKPGLIENRINEGTKAAFDSLERTTTDQ